MDAAAQLRARFGACEKARGSAEEARALLEAELVKVRAGLAALEVKLTQTEADLAACTARVAAPVVTPVPASVAAPAALEAAAAVTAAAPVQARKPASLSAARGGKADDLKLIRGVGPVLEGLRHKLGYFHFDQIAAWTASEIAWVDDNLEGFRGRVTWDDWVSQARDPAAGKPPWAGGAQ